MKINNFGYLSLVLFVLLILDSRLQISNYSYIALAIAIPTLFKLTTKNAIDRFLGDLSYPIYLLHQPVHSLVNLFIPNSPLITNYFVIILISIGSLIWIKKPVNRIRHSISIWRKNPI